MKTVEQEQGSRLRHVLAPGCRTRWESWLAPIHTTINQDTPIAVTV